MKTVRTVLFWCHLVAGLVAGLIVLVMSVTGVLLTYEKQMLLWADTRATGYRPPDVPMPVQSPERLLASAVAAGLAPTSLTVRADTGVPASVSSPNPGGRGERTTFIDPYTGALLGEGSAGTHQFFRSMTDWHRWLAREGAARAVGKATTGASNLAFLLIVVSGLYLWLPRGWTWPQFKNVLWFKRGGSSWARDFNWHHVIGFWCAVPLFVVVLAGVVISYPWASNLVLRAAGDTPAAGGRPPGPQPGGRDAGGPTAASWSGLDALVATAQAHRTDWRAISARLPRDAAAPVVFSVDAGMGGEPQKRDTVTIDRGGNVVKVERFADGSRGRRWRTVLRFAHTGEVLGALGQTIAGIASLGACVLAYTGAALSWRRWRTWRRRRTA